MISIKCSKHPDCEATNACLQCGLLCNMDFKEENLKHHSTLIISDSIRDLYEALFIQEQVQALSLFIAKLKERIGIQLDQAANANNQRGKIAKERELKRLSGIQGSNPHLMKEIILHAIKMNRSQNLNNNDFEFKELHKVINKLLQNKVASEKNEKYGEKRICRINNIVKMLPKKVYSRANSINIQTIQKIEPIALNQVKKNEKAAEGIDKTTEKRLEKNI